MLQIPDQANKCEPCNRPRNTGIQNPHSESEWSSHECQCKQKVPNPVFFLLDFVAYLKVPLLLRFGCVTPFISATADTPPPDLEGRVPYCLPCVQIRPIRRRSEDHSLE